MSVAVPSVVHGMPDAEYHADPVEGGSLSSTGARRILDSPARFRWELEHRVEKAAFDVGHALHAKVLGVGSPVIPYPDEHLTPSGNASTKAATVAWVDEQRAAGLVPVTPAQLGDVDAMAEAVLAHPLARSLVEAAGHSEVSVFATDPDTGVRVRARLDRLPDDGPAVDLKTTSGSASPVGFGRDAAKHGYPVQDVWYVDALKWATGDEREFRFVVVEKARPHLVAVHGFPEVVRLGARDLAARARATYAECVATGVWPAYGDDLIETQIPAYWWTQVDEDVAEMEVV